LNHVFLSLGSNLGDRRRNLEDALARLEAEHVPVAARSSFYESAPQDFEDQPWFLNMVAECETDHSPRHLLAILLKVEREGGRIRGTRPKGPRVIDLDILLYGDSIIDTPQLTVPHPRMLARRFVLEPLLEIAPNLRHPLTHQPFSESLNDVAGQPLRKLTD
jgi:2-amino-4-hydroxy-6-hydroxymethyldihydropteridine diphosphokinase